MSQRGIVRFSGTERVVHLLYLVCFLTLAGTGVIFYLPQLGIYAGGEVGLLNRLIHRVAAVVLMACPLLYLVFDLRGFATSVGRSFSWGRADAGWFAHGLAYYWTGSREGIPPQDKFNTGQKLHAVLQVLCFGVFAATGLIVWAWGPGLAPSTFILNLILHDIAFVVSMGGFLIHVYLVLAHPLTRPHINAMVDGRISDEDARELYPLWYARVRGASARGK
ncbi:MAG: cytochrome b/b6 domain-containing protein [Candidatus Rokubacteria bacterium]|nr:cytochrome b/b6 domain-containing protein [Candidatus Rokubacteria bacterium]